MLLFYFLKFCKMWLFVYINILFMLTCNWFIVIIENKIILFKVSVFTSDVVNVYRYNSQKQSSLWSCIIFNNTEETWDKNQIENHYPRVILLSSNKRISDCLGISLFSLGVKSKSVFTHIDIHVPFPSQMEIYSWL